MEIIFFDMQMFWFAQIASNVLFYRLEFCDGKSHGNYIVYLFETLKFCLA